MYSEAWVYKCGSRPSEAEASEAFFVALDKERLAETWAAELRTQIAQENKLPLLYPRGLASERAPAAELIEEMRESCKRGWAHLPDAKNDWFSVVVTVGGATFVVLIGIA